MCIENNCIVLLYVALTDPVANNKNCEQLAKTLTFNFLFDFKHYTCVISKPSFVIVVNYSDIAEVFVLLLSKNLTIFIKHYYCSTVHNFSHKILTNVALR